MQATSFQNLTSHLIDNNPPRVWSLLVTVFGELAQEQDKRISGALLRQLCALLDVKPEAMRVALHRLRKDNWIESERTGRTSTYFLSPWGRAQSMRASPRIYCTGPTVSQAWSVLFNPARPAQEDDYPGVWLSSNWLVTSQMPKRDDVFATKIDIKERPPEWLRNRLCPETLVELSQDFLRSLQALSLEPQQFAQLTAIQVSVLRVLLVHRWRRIILKAPLLPDYVFPDGWRAQECRALYARLLVQWPKQRLETLEQQPQRAGGCCQ